MTVNKKDKFIISTIVFILIFALAIFARLYKLGDLPGGLQRDESTVAMNAYNLYHNGTDFVGNVNPFYMTDWGDGHSNMYVWLTMFPLAINHGVMTNFVSRFPQAAISLLSLLCVYGIGKRTFGRKYAIYALLFLAVSPWHIMMSRWGLDANLAPGFYIIAFYFLVLSFEYPVALIASAIMYGLTLYTYAVTWAVVPVTLVLLFLYLFFSKKIRFGKIVIISVATLFLVAVPPMLFVLINNGVLGDIKLPFFSIMRMNGYRGDEVSSNVVSDLFTNIKQAYHLFVYQADAGEVWEIRKPWGLFYDLGRLFIVIGGICLLIRSIKALAERVFSYEILFFILVISSSITCFVTYPHLHRINLFYIPLILVGAYGMYSIDVLVGLKKECFANVYAVVSTVAFLALFCLFWKDYTGEYRDLVEAYWGIGMDQCVDIALTACEENEIDMLTVEKAAQWPKLVLYTQTIAPTFTRDVVYEKYPIPWSFKTEEGVTIQTRIDYENITTDSVYIIYFTDYDIFADNYNLIKVKDWYVAIPKNDG